MARSTDTITTRLPKEQRPIIEAAADREGVALSAWARKRLLRAALEELAPEAELVGARRPAEEEVPA